MSIAINLNSLLPSDVRPRANITLKEFPPIQRFFIISIFVKYKFRLLIEFMEFLVNATDLSFPQKYCMYFAPPACDACATHLTIFYVFALILFVESRKIWDVLFFSFLDLSVTFAFRLGLPCFWVTNSGVLSSISRRIGLGIVQYMTEFHESMAFLYRYFTTTLLVIDTNGKLNFLPQILNYLDVW